MTPVNLAPTVCDGCRLTRVNGHLTLVHKSTREHKPLHPKKVTS